MLKQFELTNIGPVAPETEDISVTEKRKQSLAKRILGRLRFFRRMKIDTATLDRFHEENVFRSNEGTWQIRNR